MNSAQDLITIPFIKGHANGNDFIFIFKHNISSKIINKYFIHHICNRHLGVGADGLFIISDSQKADFKLDYYNSDGSWETLCANGSRCAVFLMHQMKKISSSCTFITGDGIHSASIVNKNIIKMTMNTPRYKSDLISPEGYSGYFIDSGAKHFVCQNNNLNEKLALEVGEKIRNSKIFSPNGINVNFYCLQNDNKIKILTYEKGVESVMRSCASGSTAVVYHLSQKQNIKSPITTVSPGGLLKFIFNKSWTKVNIIAHAEIICSGNFNAYKNYSTKSLSLKI